MGVMEDHELAELVVHPPSPSQLVLSSRISRSSGAASNPVQQLWTVSVNPVASTSTSSPYLTPNSEWMSPGLSLTMPQLPECLANLLEVAVVPVVEPDVLVKDNSVSSYHGDILVLSICVRTPNHLKSR